MYLSPVFIFNSRREYHAEAKLNTSYKVIENEIGVQGYKIYEIYNRMIVSN